MSNTSQPKRRRFTAAFKAEVVLSLLAGNQSAAQLCREHEISPNLLQSWKETFLKNAASAFDGPRQQSHDAARVADLERTLGQVTLENTILKKASSLLSQSKGKLS